MVSLAGLKGPIIGLVLCVAYSSMVIDIIQIVKVRTGENTYPPAVVAMLVCSICEMLWLVHYFIVSGKGPVWKASNAAAGALFWACFGFGAIVATTTLRHHNRYCGPSNTIRADCSGVLRGTMGLGWSLFGLNLIFIGLIAALVSSSHGRWSEPLWNTPERIHPNADLDQEPKH